MQKSVTDAVIPILNGQGFVRYVDHMGSDARIVETARLTSNTKGRTGADDRNLLRYLMRHRHTTPFEFCQVVFHVRVPMDLWRQAIRHRMSSVNEYSTRYSEAIDEKAKTPPDKWRKQSATNRQGSSGDRVSCWPSGWKATKEPDGTTSLHYEGEGYENHIYDLPPACENPGGYLSLREQELHEHAARVYDERLKFGVAFEQARKDLPLSNFTEAYWRFDLHNLLHFFSLRLDSHAQSEIRELASAMASIVDSLFPQVWQAFKDYRLSAVSLTALDQEKIAGLTATGTAPPWTREQFDAAEGPVDWKGLNRCRERDECWGKLLKLNLVAGD